MSISRVKCSIGLSANPLKRLSARRPSLDRLSSVGGPIRKQEVPCQLSPRSSPAAAASGSCSRSGSSPSRRSTPLGAKLADETQDDTASFLPESAESTEVVQILDDGVRVRRDHPGPDRLPARRRADRRRPAEDRRGRRGARRALRTRSCRWCARRSRRSPRRPPARRRRGGAAGRGRHRRGRPHRRLPGGRPRLHHPHRPHRLREGRRLGPERPRHDRRRVRRDADHRHRRPRLLDRRRGGLRRLRREAPDRERACWCCSCSA